MRKKKFEKIKKTPIIEKIAVEWSSMFSSGYCYNVACFKCMTLDIINNGKYCYKCGSVMILLRPFKLCDSCHKTQSVYNKHCEKCGKELEKAHYRRVLKRISIFGPQKIEKIEETEVIKNAIH